MRAIGQVFSMFILPGSSLGVLGLSVFSTDTTAEFLRSSTALSFTLRPNTTADPISYHVPLDGLSFTAGVLSTSRDVKDEFGLLTVVGEGAYTTFDHVKAVLDDYVQSDDVYIKAFASGLLFSASSHVNLPSEVFDSLSSEYGTGVYITTSAETTFSNLSQHSVVAFDQTPSSGPYAYRFDNATRSLTLWPVYRLYPDTQAAFVYGVTPGSNNDFIRLSGAQHNAGDHASIPVPSRLYARASNLPLAGLRVAVKDIYDITGLKTGCGSRAYYALYPPRDVTAPSVQRLINQGAVIVGKTKTSQFAHGEAATADWVDQLCPFNPRGDGYQDPASSSSGSAAATAAYEWLDHAIGSDTGGSIRSPAGQQGLFGIRPSFGAISLSNVMPLSNVMDTAGYFARDGPGFANFGRAWYNHRFMSYVTFPRILRLPSDSWPVTGDAGAIYADFINQLISLLGAQTENATLLEIWTKTSTVNATLRDYLGTTYPTLIGAYQYHHFISPFVADHKNAHAGRNPFFDPSPRTRWAYAIERGTAAYDEEERRRQEFSSWIDHYVFPADNSSCSNSLLVYPQTGGFPHYRDRYLEFPPIPTGFNNYRIASFAGLPDVVIPLGQVPYVSNVTAQQEYLPVTISIVAGKGCDYMLLDLVEKLSEAGIIRGVLSGPYTFPII